jgi:hypothetical protein
MHKRVAPKMGDVLLAKNGTTGVAAIVDRDIIFDIYVSLAWLRSKGEVVSEFLLHFINSPVDYLFFVGRLFLVSWFLFVIGLIGRLFVFGFRVISGNKLTLRVFLEDEDLEHLFLLVFC